MSDVDPMIMDVSSWTRLPEVDKYARARGITREEAVRLLVNSGLSHEPPAEDLMPLWEVDLGERITLVFNYVRMDGGISGMMHLDDGSIVDIDLTEERSRALYNALAEHYR